MVKKEIKVCNICKLGIDESREFVRVTQFKKKDDIFTDGFYHIKCFQDKMTGGEEIRRLKGQTDYLLKATMEKLGLIN